MSNKWATVAQHNREPAMEFAERHPFEMSKQPSSPKIPGDKLVLALISVVRTLVIELSKRGVLDAEELITYRIFRTFGTDGFFIN